MTIGAVEATAVGISGAAAVLTGFGIVVPPGIATSGLGKATVGVLVMILDDWTVVDSAGLALIGVSSCMGITLSLAGVLCVETPGKATRDRAPSTCKSICLLSTCRSA